MRRLNRSSGFVRLIRKPNLVGGRIFTILFVGLFAIAGATYGAAQSFAATYPYITDCDDLVMYYGKYTTSVRYHNCVKLVQAIMRYSVDDAYTVGPNISCGASGPIGIDGNFGPQTKAYVMCFQASKTIWVGGSNYLGAISADGIVGPDTWKKIKGMVWYWRYYSGYNLKGIY